MSHSLPDSWKADLWRFLFPCVIMWKLFFFNAHLSFMCTTKTTDNKMMAFKLKKKKKSTGL